MALYIYFFLLLFRSSLFILIHCRIIWYLGYRALNRSFLSLVVICIVSASWLLVFHHLFYYLLLLVHFQLDRLEVYVLGFVARVHLVNHVRPVSHMSMFPLNANVKKT